MELLSEKNRRWKLVLGEEDSNMSTDDKKMANCLDFLYEKNTGNSGQDDNNKSKSKKGGRENSKPFVATWLGDIRRYFPTNVVQIMQQEAIDNLGLKQLLFEPEILESLEPNVQLVSTLVNLKNLIPSETKATAEIIVRKVVDDIEKRLREKMRQAITGSLNRASRNYRPKHNEIDWNKTIRANFKHYQKEYKTIIPERRIGYGRKQTSLRDIIVCVDQSGSMASSVVYSSILAAVMASIKAVQTSLIVFDTEVVDLTPELANPVDVLFGTQLGGGTDINLAIQYCEGLIQRPNDTILILISDLYEGGNERALISRYAKLSAAGVNCICLLALDDEGAPSFDTDLAKVLASFNIPSFACTPDAFPDLIAAAIQKQNMTQWANQHNIKLAA